MAKKIKCERCHTEHGGFHLCLGDIPLPKFGTKTYRSFVDKSSAIQGARHEAALERHEGIAKAYESGIPLEKLARDHDVKEETIKRIIRQHKERAA